MRFKKKPIMNQVLNRKITNLKRVAGRYKRIRAGINQQHYNTRVNWACKSKVTVEEKMMRKRAHSNREEGRWSLRRASSWRSRRMRRRQRDHRHAGCPPTCENHAWKLQIQTRIRWLSPPISGMCRTCKFWPHNTCRISIRDNLNSPESW